MDAEQDFILELVVVQGHESETRTERLEKEDRLKNGVIDILNRSDKRAYSEQAFRPSPE
jgi:hypothetical protein